MARETGILSLVESYQKLKKWYLIPHCSTLSFNRYVSMVKWSNLGKGVALSSTRRCSSYWKEILRVVLDYGRQVYFYIYIYIYKEMFLNSFFSFYIWLITKGFEYIQSWEETQEFWRFFKNFFGFYPVLLASVRALLYLQKGFKRFVCSLSLARACARTQGYLHTHTHAHIYIAQYGKYQARYFFLSSEFYSFGVPNYAGYQPN